MLIDFRLPHGIHRRSVNPGNGVLAFAGGALLDAEQSSRNEVDPGFQAWCEGRPHGIPAERRAMKVSLFLTAFLAMDRVKASATPDRHFDPRHRRSRGDDWQQGGSFLGFFRSFGAGGALSWFVGSADGNHAA